MAVKKHTNPVTGKTSVCRASSDANCRFSEEYTKRQKERASRQRQPTTMTQRAIGDVHELFCATYLVEHGGNFVNTTAQAYQRQRRENTYQQCVQNPENIPTLNFLHDIAYSSMSKVPPPTGDVMFAERDNMAGEVWDIIYCSGTDDIKVSCKAGDMEDKSYRFSTTGQTFHALVPVTTEFFGDRSQQGSINDILFSHRHTTRDYINAVTRELVDSYHRGCNDQLRGDDTVDVSTVETLSSLTYENVIGHGDYYKTHSDGSVTYYPPCDRWGSTKIVNVSPVSQPWENNTTVTYTVVTDDGHDTPLYHVRMRAKFKDGKHKKLVIRNGFPQGFGATFQLQVATNDEHDAVT